MTTPLDRWCARRTAERLEARSPPADDDADSSRAPRSSSVSAAEGVEEGLARGVEKRESRCALMRWGMRRSSTKALKSVAPVCWLASTDSARRRKLCRSLSWSCTRSTGCWGLIALTRLPIA